MKICLLIILIFSFNQTPFAKINWISSYDEAIRLAKEQNKFIFIKYTATWCKPCVEMEGDIDRDTTFAKYFNENFINVKIYDNSTTSRSFDGKGKKIIFNNCNNCGRISYQKIATLPTMLFVSKNGVKITGVGFYPGLKSLLEMATTINDHPELNINVSELSDSLTEESIVLIDKFLLIFKNSDIGKDVIHELISKNQDWANYIFQEKSHLLDYKDVLNYVNENLDDTLKYVPIIEHLIIYKLRQEGNIFNERKFNELASEVSESKLISQKKALAYLYAYLELNDNKFLSRQTKEKSLVYSKSLLEVFPETRDLDLIYEAIQQIIKNQVTDEYLMRIKPKFEELSKVRGHYLYFDILSFLEYNTGNKEVAYKLSAKAKEVSLQQGYKNMIPLLRQHKEILSPRKVD